MRFALHKSTHVFLPLVLEHTSHADALSRPAHLFNHTQFSGVQQAYL